MDVIMKRRKTTLTVLFLKCSERFDTCQTLSAPLHPASKVLIQGLKLQSQFTHTESHCCGLAATVTTNKLATIAFKGNAASGWTQLMPVFSRLHIQLCLTFQTWQEVRKWSSTEFSRLGQQASKAADCCCCKPLLQGCILLCVPVSVCECLYTYYLRTCPVLMIPCSL